MQYELFQSVLVTSCVYEISSQMCKILGFSWQFLFILSSGYCTVCIVHTTSLPISRDDLSIKDAIKKLQKLSTQELIQSCILTFFSKRPYAVL